MEDAKHILHVADFLTKTCGPQADQVKILAAIESAKAFVNLKEVCQNSISTNRLVGLIVTDLTFHSFLFFLKNILLKYSISFI